MFSERSYVSVSISSAHRTDHAFESILTNLYEININESMKKCAYVSSKFIEFSSLRSLFRHKSRSQNRCRHRDVLFLYWKHRFEFIFDLSCKLSSIESNNFHRSLSLFCSWNAFFKRVSIETIWFHQRNIIETASIQRLEDYWHRTSRENMFSSFYRPQIYIMRRDT